MAQSSGEALADVVDREVARSLRRHAEIQARLIGYEIAITALLGALDRTGALPLAVAKQAIDQAATSIAATSHSSEALTVLRQLSSRIEPPVEPGPEPPADQ